jgi:hypothetical protein
MGASWGQEVWQPVAVKAVWLGRAWMLSWQHRSKLGILLVRVCMPPHPACLQHTCAATCLPAACPALLLKCCRVCWVSAAPTA